MKFLRETRLACDGFRPALIPQRIEAGQLRLGWCHYIDSVQRGWKCRVYFHGPHRYENGVCVKGIVDEVNLPKHEVSLRVREYGTKRRTTAREISNRVADGVAPRYRRASVWPQHWTVEPERSLAACQGRRYDDFATWAHSPS